MKNVRLVLFLSIVFWGCARMSTLNLTEHLYSKMPEHIVWIQLAGFHEDHIPLIQFNNLEMGQVTFPEMFQCLGKKWEYSFNKLRPDAQSSFVSELNGAKIVNNDCSDMSSEFVWDILKNRNYRIAMLERGASEKNSFEKYFKCSKTPQSSFENIVLWKMDKAPLKGNYFHYQDPEEILYTNFRPGVYHDKACQSDRCYSTLLNNFKTIYRISHLENYPTFTLVRDFNYQNAIKNKDVGLLKEYLNEIDQLVKYLVNLNDPSLLVVLTSAEAQKIEFPFEGKDWVDYNSKGNNLIFLRPELMGAVFARGPLAENFCGIFPDSQMRKRILTVPDSKRMNWKMLLNLD